MKLDTLLKRKAKYEAELSNMHYLYDNLRCPSSYYTSLHNLEFRIAKLNVQIAGLLKETDAYKNYLEQKRYYTQFGLG